MDNDFGTDSEANADTPKRKSSAKRLLSTDSQDKSDRERDKKRQKRGKQLRDHNAPRMPLNGYVRFLNANRERVKTANPTKNFADITKLLAADWSALAADQKQKYLDEAEKDKEKYLKELQEYQRTEAYQEFQQKQKQRKDQKIKDKLKDQPSGSGEGPSSSGAAGKPMAGSSAHNINANEDNEASAAEAFSMDTNASTLDLPIFTEEFLEHNRIREQELRSLRKLNTEYEEQNAILSKHIDNMKAAIEKLEVESVQQRNNNQALGQHLQHLRTTLVRGLASVAIPGTNETPTLDNIDDYIVRLHARVTAKDKTRDAEHLCDTVRAIVSGLDYNLV